MSHGGQCCQGLIMESPSIDEVRSLAYESLLGRFAMGVENFDRRMFDLSPEQADMAFLPDAGVGNWPVRVLIGHLADAELVNAHRIRRTLAEDKPLFAEWDENLFIDRGLYGTADGPRPPIAGFVATIHTLRRWTVEHYNSLTPIQLARVGMHPTRGPLSVRNIIELNTWHLEHHAAFLNRKVERLLGPAPAEDENTGSCGSGCCCKH